MSSPVGRDAHYINEVAQVAQQDSQNNINWCTWGSARWWDILLHSFERQLLKKTKT